MGQRRLNPDQLSDTGILGLYLTRLFPWFAVGHRGVVVGVFVMAVCAGLNIAGIIVVATTSIWLFCLLSAPFAIIVMGLMELM